MGPREVSFLISRSLGKYHKLIVPEEVLSEYGKKISNRCNGFGSRLKI